MIESFFITTSYGKIKIYKQGNGEKTLLLLHGGGSDNSMLSWKEVFDNIDDSYTVYAMDLLGQGDSDYYPDICGDRFYDIHVDSVYQMVNYLKINDFTLAGLSMGGAIAIGFTLKYQNYVKQLIAVDSWGLSKKIIWHKFSYLLINKTNFTIKQYRWLAKSKFLAKWSIKYSLINDKKLITNQLVEEVMQSCKNDRAGLSMQNYQRSSITKNGTIPYYVDQLEKIDIPVKYVIGEKDNLVKLKDIKLACELTKNGKLFVLKNCKHWSVKENPKEFMEIISL